jgi:hypothetical protein
MPTPEIMDGPTYGQLSQWNAWAFLACLVPLTGLFFESDIAVPGWTALMLVLGTALVVVAFLTGWAAPMKKRAEFQRGYTTQLGTAIRQPDLFLVHPKSKVVLSKPREPRPDRLPSTRR